MIDRPDAALLEAWTSTRSEEAFAILSRRYGGLLYHGALRRTGRDDLAGEAAQNALLILARKAPRLHHLPSLAGWLHRTVGYEASKLLRRERRHQARMKQLPPHHDDADASWKDAAPLLDRALDELPERDRQVIFLKYFDGLSFEQMARQFGGKPAAWRQRGSRAVERLRVSLTRRGAVVSSTALSAGLGTSLGQSAPAAFLAALPHPATAAAALSWQTLTFHSIHLMKLKPSAVIAAALLVSLIPLGIQASALLDARRRVDLLEAASRPGSAADPSRRSSRVESGSNFGISLASLADGLLAAEQGDPLRGLQTERRIAAMDRDELERRLVESGEIDLGVDRRRVLVQALFTRFCKLTPYSGTPPERVLALASRLSVQMRVDGGDIWGPAEKVIGQWVTDKPDEAAAWYRSAWRSGSLGDPTRSALVAGKVFNGLQARDPDAAMEFYRSLSDTERQVVLGGGGAYADPDLLFELSLDIEDDRLRGISLERAFGNAEGKSPAEIREWIERVGCDDLEAARLIAGAAGSSAALAATTPEVIAARLEWLREASEGLDAARAAGSFLSNIGRSHPGATFEALDAEWERNPDERVLAAYISGAYFNEATVTDAIRRSRLITDERLREESLRQLLRVPRPNGDARELARKGGLSDEELARVLPSKP